MEALRANRHTTSSEDLTTIVLSLWMVVGLLVDAYKHSTDPQLESFWTPWHALFYSGFLAVAAWLFIVTFRRQRPGRSFLEWAPAGYRLAVIGVGLFALGGIGDAVWHSVLGVETSLDALLSPTHLLLFVGMLLIVSAPLRGAWSDHGAGLAPGWRDFLVPFASLTFSAALVAFFFQYAWLPALDWPPRVLYNGVTGQGEATAALGVLGSVVTTAVLMGPVLLLVRRWQPPMGAVTAFLLVVNLFIAVAFDEDLSGLVPSLAAGLAADVMISLRLDRRVLAAVTPFVLWAAYFMVVGRIENGLAWPPEIWGGIIVFGVLTSLAIELGLRAVSRLATLDAFRPSDDSLVA